MTLAPVEPLVEISDAVCGAFRARLKEAGYTEQALAAAEAIAPRMFDFARLSLVQWTLAKAGDPSSELLRLFAYSGEMADSSARSLLGDLVYRALLDAGVLYHSENARVKSAFQLLPADGLLILADPPADGRDAVMGPGPTTLDLLRLLPATITGPALDLGCGAGTLALAAARRGASASVGTDVNPRAVQMARFNGRLNALSTVFHTGDLYEPVSGMRFSLIAAQPPYVVRPSQTPELTYLHGGTVGDEVAWRMVAAAPTVLAPGGRALFLFESAVRPREPLPVRLRACLNGAPVDVIALVAPGVPLALQAIGYATLESASPGPDFDAAVLRYRTHFDDLGVSAFNHILIALRAGTEGAPGGAFTIILPVPAVGKIDSAGVDAAFAALDLASRPDDDLASAAVRGASRARWREERARPDLSLEPVRCICFSVGAVGTDREITEAGYALFRALEGAESVEQAVAVYAEECGVPPAEVRRKVLDFVREGLARGLLEPRHQAKPR